MAIEIEVLKGITLRQLSLEDAFEFFRLIDRNRSHLSQFGNNTAEKYPDLESMEESFRNPDNQNWLRFGIQCFGVLAGGIELILEGKRAILVFYLHAKFQEIGLMTTSARRLIRYAFEKMGVEEIVAKVHKDNSKSRKVMWYLGFVEKGKKGNFLLYSKRK